MQSATLRFVVLLGILLLVVLAIRSLNLKTPSIVSTMLRTGNCSQPCFWGLQPGKTDIQRVVSVLEANGNVELYEPNEDIDPFHVHSVCWRMGADKTWKGCVRGDTVYSGNNIHYLYVWPPHDSVRLGDVINALGEPTHVEACGSITGLVTNLPEPIWAIEIQINSILIRAYKRFDDLRVDPDMFVYKLMYLPENANFVSPDHNWKGFVQIPDRDFSCVESEAP